MRRHIRVPWPYYFSNTAQDLQLAEVILHLDRLLFVGVCGCPVIRLKLSERSG